MAVRAACNVNVMTTTELAPGIAISHRLYGVGVVVRLHGRTVVEAQWPGKPYTTRESICDVTVHAPPAPKPRRRGAHRRADTR